MILAGPGQTQAEEARCFPPAMVSTWLKTTHNETQMDYGVTVQGKLLQLYTSPGGGTWTLVVTEGTTLSCVVVAGTNWRRKLPSIPTPQLWPPVPEPTSMSSDKPECTVASTAVQKLIRSMPMGYLIETLEGSDLAVFMKAYNATEPVTEFQADKLYVVGSPYDVLMYVGVLAYEDCIIDQGLIKADIYQRFKRGKPYVVAPEPVGWTIAYQGGAFDTDFGLGWPNLIPLPRDPDARLMLAPRPRPEHSCNLDADDHVEYILDTLPLSDVFETIRGPALEIFLRAFNATAPVTDHQADAIVIISSEIDPYHYRGVMIKDGCVVLDGLMKIETYHKFKSGVPLKPGQLI